MRDDHCASTYGMIGMEGRSLGLLLALEFWKLCLHIDGSSPESDFALFCSVDSLVESTCSPLFYRYRIPVRVLEFIMAL